MTVSSQATVDAIGESCEDADFSLVSGEVFYLHHELPPTVVVYDPLAIDIETACGKVHREVDLIQDQLLSLPLVAPAGSECGLSVTATIMNSTIRCDLPPDGACADFDESTCPETDAGTTDTGDTTDTTG
ncbi:MAG: hypothetical protein KC431_26195 [Myxococcales bacterium]|nr:hypothetical protein [Myxococcales bacterium]